jgi:hypothetical protein
MALLITVVVSLVAGFGFGRVKHPANLKVAAVKAEIAKLEAEFTGGLNAEEAKVRAVVARIKAAL